MASLTRIWDLPTRIFHWVLVGLCITSVVSVELDALVWHERSGMAILVLVISRIVWGIVGSDTAKFSFFLRGPNAMLAYIRSLRGANHQRPLGHNPVGGWVVVVFVFLLLAQVATGLFANDEIVFDGPLAPLVSRELSDTLTSIHHLTVKGLIALIAIHVIANFGYWLVLKQNLIKPMVSGNAVLNSPTEVRLRWGNNWLALCIVMIVASVVGVFIGYR